MKIKPLTRYCVAMLIAGLVGSFSGYLTGYTHGGRDRRANVEESQPEAASKIFVEVISIYDGDTFTCNIDGWPDIIGKRISVRVKGIDTPEIRGGTERTKELARAARMYTVTVLDGAEKVELRNLERDKYFRINADVYIDGESLADGLIATGHAKPYNGDGPRPEW
jgi:micrococcal nuclease